MFNVYLRNWIDEIIGEEENEYEFVSEETLIMSIPFSEGEEPCMINPTIKSEMGKAESLDFTINPGMKYYNAYQELKTLIRVEYKETVDSEDAETIFFGRIVTINTSNLLAVKSIHAEGAYSVLQDTPITGLEEELQPKITQWQQFVGVITEHNGWIGDDNNDSWKKMVIVDTNNMQSPISLKDEQKKCAPTSWNTTMSAIDDLIGNNGGYMKVRYDPTKNIPLQLEWHKKFFRDLGDGLRPSFQLAKNIIDLSSTDEISELFTRVIPVGHKSSTKKNSKETGYIYIDSSKYISVKSLASSLSEEWLYDNFQSRDEFRNAELYYGIIYKTVNFPNADTVAKLEEYAHDWIKRNYFGALRSFTVKAIDMKMVNMEDAPSHLILAGDCVDISYPYFDQFGNRQMTTETRLVCKSAQIVLFNPEQNTYTIGIPNDAVDFEYGEKKKTKKNSSTTAGTAATPPPSNSTVYDLSFDAAYSYLRWFYYANDWGDIKTAQSYHAYSWRCGGLTSWTDKVPADTFRANGQPKHEHIEIVDEPVYDPAYPGDPDHITGYIPTSKEIYDYYYVKISGLSDVRLMGHYTMSKVPNGLEQGIDPPGYNIQNGYTYGFGYVEGTDDAVAFSWNEYTSGKGNPDDSGSAAIEPLFHFPNLFGSHSLSGATSPDTGANSGNTDEEGNPGWVDDKGNTIVKIFPELGTIGVGYGYVYETNPDGSMKTDDKGNPILATDENGDPIVMTDQNGNPVWAIALNEPITYLGSDNKMHTIPSGNLVVNDLKLPGIPSFMTQLAAINTAIIGNASIANAIITHLRAIIADIGNYSDVEDVNLDDLFEDVFHYEDSVGNVIQVFSTSKNYNVGDKVVYENVVYRFIRKHNKGSWDPTDVEELGDATKVDHYDSDGNAIVQVKSGTRFANTNEQIQGVAGRFILNSDGSMTIIEGGGIKIKKDDATFGIWHEGNVTAGMICEAINGDTSTKIYGNNILIGNDGSSSISLGDVFSPGNTAGTIQVNYPLIINNSMYVANDYTGADPVIIAGSLEAEEISSEYNYKVLTSNGYLTYNVLDVEKDDETNTLTITKVNNSSGRIETITFSKAASSSSYELSPIWSGNSSTGTRFKVIAHPPSDISTVLKESKGIGFGGNYNPNTDLGTVQLNTGTPVYNSGAIKSISIPYTLDLMVAPPSGEGALVASRELYSAIKTVSLSGITIDTPPTITFGSIASGRVGDTTRIDCKATDIFGSESSSITLSAKTSTSVFTDTSNNTKHRIIEFIKSDNTVVGRYPVDLYWNSGGVSAKLRTPNNVDVESGATLSPNTTYKLVYTGADGEIKTSGKTYKTPDISSNVNIRIDSKQNASSLEVLQNMYGSTADLQPLWTSGSSHKQLDQYSKYYGFRIIYDTISNAKYFYFQTPDDRYAEGKSDGVKEGHDGITGSDIELAGTGGHSSSISKGLSGVSGSIYLKKSDNTWKNLRNFSISMSFTALGFKNKNDTLKIPETAYYFFSENNYR